ncbi:MAG: hypothetical protein CSB03_00065 [Bacteroidia bacterium]|nr:MAG: hypothetical protein CSB03_00065 [Bacteroidia bacterium]
MKKKTLETYLKENRTISKEDLDALKAKHGKVKVITVVVEEPERDDDGNVVGCEAYYFAVRRPSQSQVRMLTALAQKGDDEKFLNSAIKNLVVGGDEDALEDGLVYMGVASQLKGLLKPYTSFLTKA